MSSSRTRLSALAFAVATSFSTTVVQAQAWLADRQQAEGAGIRVGDLELHPGVGLEAGYDSNVFLADTASAGKPGPEGSFMLRVSPHLYVSTLSRQRRDEAADEGTPPILTFRGGVAASYYHFFLDSARDNVQGDLDLRLNVLPSRPFSLEFHETFVRTVRPFTEQLTTPISFASNTNHVGAAAVLSTPGGVLSGRIGYDFGVGFFDAGDFQFANTFQHNATASASWRFLPKTALVWDFGFDYRTYPNSGDSATVQVSDGSRVATRIGVNGAITNTISATAMVGYGAAFFNLGDNSENFIAQADFRWQFLPGGRLGLGYGRAMYNSYVGNFYRQDRISLNSQIMLLGRIALSADLSVAFVGYGTPIRAGAPDMPLGSNEDGSTDRNDIRFVGTLFGEYRFIDWLGVNLTFRYTGDYTDYRYFAAGLTASGFDPANYQKFEGWLGVRAFW